MITEKRSGKSYPCETLYLYSIRVRFQTILLSTPHNATLLDGKDHYFCFMLRHPFSLQGNNESKSSGKCSNWRCGHGEYGKGFCKKLHFHFYLLCQMILQAMKANTKIEDSCRVEKKIGWQMLQGEKSTKYIFFQLIDSSMYHMPMCFTSI